MKKVLVVFGTRPEAIKMAPIIKELEKKKNFNIKVCVTAQHRQMLDQVLKLFEITPHYDLDIMKANQDLYDITINILDGIKRVLEDFNPDIILVHGDTTTTCATSLAAFYKKIKVGHIEAGLRTYNLYSPWPEEANRQITSVLANYHFAPTVISKANLLKENKKESNIVITGNTVIDALFLVLNKINNSKELKERILKNILNQFKIVPTSITSKDRKFILVTGHRRENFGNGFLDICASLKEIASRNPDFDIIYPVHLNPNVQKPVFKLLSEINNIFLIKPLQYEEFIYMMDRAYFIITDSGGVQEEAPSLGKPVLVMRNTTERPEAVEAGTVKLVGTNRDKIVKEAQKLIDNKEYYNSMSRANNPYGDGKASKKIVDFLELKIDNGEFKVETREYAIK